MDPARRCGKTHRAPGSDRGICEHRGILGALGRFSAVGSTGDSRVDHASLDSATPSKAHSGDRDPSRLRRARQSKSPPRSAKSHAPLISDTVGEVEWMKLDFARLRARRPAATAAELAAAEKLLTGCSLELSRLQSKTPAQTVKRYD